MTGTQTAPEYLLSPPGYPAGTKLRKVLPEGRGTSGILVIGEAPGENEDKDGLPFRPYAEAGSLLERVLSRAGIPRDSLTLSNIVWYRPPRNWLAEAPWEAVAIHYCQSFLDDLIQQVQPKVILALGGIAFRELTGISGPKQGIEMVRGFQVQSLRYGVPVVGTYHPAFLRRGSKSREEEGPQGKTKSAGGGTAGMALLGVLIRDLKLAQDIAQNGPKKFIPKNYLLGASLQDWKDAIGFLGHHPEQMIYYDFETQDSLQKESEEDQERVVREPTQFQICIGDLVLVSPWNSEMGGIVRRLMELPNPKADWNGRKFDRPILRELGARTDIGEWHDLMSLWHFSQPDLPQGLQYAGSFFVPELGPWKHTSGSDPLLYGAYDVDVPERIFTSLRQSLQLTRSPSSGISLWGDGLYGGYQGQVTKLAPVLDKMSARGIPVDEDRRTELDIRFGTLMEEQFTQIQLLVDDEVKEVHVYKKEPKDFQAEAAATLKIRQGSEERVVPSKWLRVPGEASQKCGCWWTKPKRKSKEPILDGLESPVPEDCPKCSNTGKLQVQSLLWGKMKPFLPGSWQQVLNYIKYQRNKDIDQRAAKKGWKSQEELTLALATAARLTHWEVPTDYKSGKESTGEAGLRRLAAKTGDLVLPLVLANREIGKLRGTYVQGWAPIGVQEFRIESEEKFRTEEEPSWAKGLYTFGSVVRIGRVHPFFGFRPSTGQLSSENPNAQNYPVHSDLSHAMNQMLRARPGFKLVKFDWKSFHAITAGFEAQDPDFIRIARIDIHSFLSIVGILRLERPEVAFGWDDDELRDRVKFYRKAPKTYDAYARSRFPGGMTFDDIRNVLAKRVVYGWEFGQGSRSLWMLNQESFKHIPEAEQMQEALRKLFPKMDKWQTDVRLEADQQHQLVSRYGYVRRFWDVYQRKPVLDNYQSRRGDRIYTHPTSGMRWLLKPGDDHEAVVAFRPANDAFGIKRERMVMLSEAGWDDEYGLINEVHDSLNFEVENRKVDNCISDVSGLMTQPSKYLIDPVVAPSGLWCGVSVAVGEDMDCCKELK